MGNLKQKYTPEEWDELVCSTKPGFVEKRMKVMELAKNNYPILIIRKDDLCEFIHINDGFYRSKFGIMNKSIAMTPFKAFSEKLFDFYHDERDY